MLLSPFFSQRCMAAVCFLTVCGMAEAATAPITIKPTTTLSAEMANNTSASSSFLALVNGDTGPRNVSKSAQGTLLYSGNTTKIYAHLMGWFGTSSHMNVGYASNTQATVHKQVADMKSRGIAGAILDWYGQNNITDQTAGYLASESEAQGFTFSLMEDVGSISGYAQNNNCDGTQKLIDDLNYAYTAYEVSPAYLRVNSRPVVFFFGVDAYYIDWDDVRAKVTGNPLFVFENSGAFTAPNSDGGFAWIQINSSNPYDIETSYLDGFYTTALANPAKLAYGTGYVGFNDTLAGWTGNRVMHRQCATTWLNSFAEAGKYFNSSRQLPFLQVATWNDYEEGTEIETGIDNCLRVVAWTSGGTLYWKLEGEGPANSVSYFRVFISTDGNNLMTLKDVSSSTRSLSLSSWVLSTSVTYKLFVKAIGKPSIFNQISNAVAYRRGDVVPTARIAVTPSSGVVPLTVTASTSSSTDPDGNVASSKIDFGDGTVAAGPKATHTYQNFDVYSVRAYVYDDKGAMGTAAATVTSRQPNSGVTIWQPASGSVFPNYFRVIASASGAAKITSMTVYVNGKSTYRINDDRLDISLRFSDGDYLIGVNAWDATGAVYTATTKIHLGVGTNILPVAQVKLDNYSPAVGMGIRACTAQSYDPDGGISRSVVDFGDGTRQSGTTTYHTYTSAGTFPVIVTVTDNRGATASTTTSLTVH